MLFINPFLNYSMFILETSIFFMVRKQLSEIQKFFQFYSSFFLLNYIQTRMYALNVYKN